ncbi:fungal-specific transcription factor domain-containing protein [Paecilomyces variotii]|uniref:Fungal-specific transcription factor domain-containing protein n=1 Tax=Byssochlamys spectabilis TaxID=264951 RepID=A0A443HIH4_BYSSP|nr:fungal-specific transcription factor domain-containing protein [Paecilomyces variotii]KAJ9315862.1 transcriptional regulator family: Fungal Specific TF [Paecilomyces variotii]KAJ9363672.1 transcriptional regulator family: Fungal Specific TF [Paecilomyces variotii]KAJ9386366.1 transcriptional regulator family: Fungal Specific TF [Paecilomyces variotii]RWQ91595.1 fungal-specific transcription factor domain-containing protein [Paecilomyces variotii]
MAAEPQFEQSAVTHPSPTTSNAGSAGTSGTNSQAQQSAPNSGHASFRRQRASRACETCHARKVRCDAASLGVPCTNCVAFSIDCRIPTPKRKKNQNKKENHSAGEEPVETRQQQDAPEPARPKEVLGYRANTMSVDGMPPTRFTESEAAQQAAHGSTYTQFMKPKFARAPIKEAGRVAYLGESSNLSLLVHDKNGTTDVVHYPLPENIRGTRARLTDLDNMEIEILHQRGAFLLPPKQLCDELVDAYFKWVAPAVPIINRSRFMRRYRDPKNPPSLLLLQSILLAGSRVCTNPQLMDQNGSTIPAAMTFYKRAKALYDANYEDDRVTIVQALVLMSWYWEGPEDVTKNVFYWSRVAITVAQGSGMHRSVENSQLSKPDKKLWKRIWWTLFTRDRSVAVALGRPVAINTDDSDVEMLTEEDFIEDEVDSPAEYPPDPVHVQFFLQYVKLCEIMGLVLSQQYSVASKTRRNNAIDLTHSDMALADWLQNCPPEVTWGRSRHHFWAALLHSNYYTTLCLLHRAHMPPATSSPSGYRVDEMAYPSRTIAFQAAAMITSIVENLQSHNEIRYTPAFIVYSLFSALIMHVYQMRSSVPSVVATSQERINICMQALKDVSKAWLVAKMVYTLFDSILGNKALEERLQKAAGKRHQRVRQENNNNRNPAKRPDHPPKRKFDDMDLGLPNGGPTPPVSYERSRPQTPAATPSRELPPHQGQPSLASLQTTPNAQRAPQEPFLGTAASRANTRPTTPFNVPFSMPATPPDLFLVTRNSPNISQSLWENFQPDQLFPDGANIFPDLMSPQDNSVDPQLQMPSQLQNPDMQPGLGINQQSLAGRTPAGTQGSPSLVSGITGGMGMQDQQQQQSVFGLQNQQQWPVQGLDPSLGGAGLDHSSQDDSWSSSSRGQGPSVPTALNVEDWFQFFGINGGLGDLAMESV